MILNDLASCTNADIRIIQYILLSYSTPLFFTYLHCALSLAAQSIVIGPVCQFVCVCGGGVCYHDNSKLRASILTKLGL